MGLVIDTSVFIAAERKGMTVEHLLEAVRGQADEPAILAAASVVELTHGIYRARNHEQQSRRRSFVDDILRNVDAAPLTRQIAQLAGQIQGDQAALGNTIDFADLLIGATAVFFDYEIVTLNVDHFQKIPNVRVGLPKF